MCGSNNEVSSSNNKQNLSCYCYCLPATSYTTSIIISNIACEKKNNSRKKRERRKCERDNKHEQYAASHDWTEHGLWILILTFFQAHQKKFLFTCNLSQTTWKVATHTWFIRLFTQRCEIKMKWNEKTNPYNNFLPFSKLWVT